MVSKSIEKRSKEKRVDPLKLPRATVVVVFLLVQITLLSAHQSLPAAERDSDFIRRENAKPGARDWQLTRVALVSNTSVRAAYIEGYCSKQSVRAGESLDICVSTNPASKFQIEIFRTGYYGGRGARLMTTLGPFEGTTQPDPRNRSQKPARMPVEAGHDADDSGRLAQRRLSGPADVSSRRRDKGPLAKLRHFHRPRRSPRRHPLPMLGQHLERLQPVAQQLFGLYAPQGKPRALGRRQFRSPLWPLCPIHRRRQRSALSRLGRVSLVRVPAQLLSGAARIRRNVCVQ